MLGAAGVPKILLTNSPPSDHRELKLETRAQNKIDNDQCRDALKHGDFLQATDWLNEFPRAIMRGDPTAYYNCHGLSFACRRTGIHAGETLSLILRDDDYLQIQYRDTLPGDLVVYFDEAENEIIHTGILVTRAADPEMWVVSKWGSGPEMLHRLQDCPYDKSRKMFYRMNKCSDAFSPKIKLLT